MRLTNSLRSFVKENKTLVYTTTATTTSSTITIVIVAYSLRSFGNILSPEQIGLVIAFLGILLPVREYFKQNEEARKEEEKRLLEIERQKEISRKQEDKQVLNLQFVAVEQSIKSLVKDIDSRFDKVEENLNQHISLYSHAGILEDVRKLQSEVQRLTAQGQYTLDIAQDTKQYLNSLTLQTCLPRFQLLNTQEKDD